MDVINKNPFRIAGILSNSSERELKKQQSKLKKYVKIGKSVDSEYDFNFLSPIERSEKNVSDAFSKIEQNQDKVSNSLFWFLDSNSIDKTALNYLKDGDQEKAIEIWKKVTFNKEITKKNYSCFNNVSTIKLLNNNKDVIKEGITTKLNLIESDFYVELSKQVADETFTINQQKQMEITIDIIFNELKKKFSLDTFSNLFDQCSNKVKKYVSKKLINKPITDAESLIKITKDNRKKDPKEAYQYAINLYNESVNSIKIIKSVVGPNDLSFKTLANKLANEILQCGIDYFNAWRDIKDPSEKAIQLLKYAKNIAIDAQIIKRINENIEGIQEWSESSSLEDHIESITSEIERFKNNNFKTINAAKQLLINTKTDINELKKILGSDNELYLNISSAIVSHSLNAIINILNAQQNNSIGYDPSFLLSFNKTLSEAQNVIDKMKTFDMNKQTQNYYSENKISIVKIKSDVQSAILNIGKSFSQQKRTTSSNSGCYIATMAYGNYDHPQVIKLRKFRDSHLNKSYLGRLFISSYYRWSPKTVELLKNKKYINFTIRKILDLLIKIIN